MSLLQPLVPTLPSHFPWHVRAEREKGENCRRSLTNRAVATKASPCKEPVLDTRTASQLTKAACWSIQAWTDQAAPLLLQPLVHR